MYYKIIKTLESFGIGVQFLTSKRSPMITKYIFELDEGIKVQKILSLDKDLEIKLGQKVRISLSHTPPGVGIEVNENNKRDHTFFIYPKRNNLELFLGYTFGFKPVVVGLDKMPHILIAGATNAGKSVLLRSIVRCLSVKNSNICRFGIIDLKRVEFNEFIGNPLMLATPVTDPDKVITGLCDILDVIEKRYIVFSKLKVKNLEEFNLLGQRRLNAIIIVIDEFADLMLNKKHAKHFRNYVQRIAQIGRAAGIHLIIATQRPSVDVIVGDIKANIPCRIALKTTTSVDSRVVLDTTGAEKLYGLGDALISLPGEDELIRFQTVLN